MLRRVALAIGAGLLVGCTGRHAPDSPARARSVPVASSPADPSVRGPSGKPASPAEGHASLPESRTSPPPNPASPPARSDAFEGAVRPVLVRRCTPCHEPGGKMYARLPFDKREVVVAIRTSILKRLKTPEDRQVLEHWLASLEEPRP